MPVDARMAMSKHRSAVVGRTDRFTPLAATSLLILTVMATLGGSALDLAVADGGKPATPATAVGRTDAYGAAVVRLGTARLVIPSGALPAHQRVSIRRVGTVHDAGGPGIPV